MVLAVLFFGFTGSANAYKITVLDPGPSTSYTIYGIGATPFDATFSACALGQDPTHPTPDKGELCFSAESLFTVNVTSLELLLPNSTALNGQAAICGSNIFSSLSCSLNGGEYTLDFTDGVITPYEDFTITIEADHPKTDPVLSPTDFNNKLTANAALAPEPSSLILLSSGLASMGVGTLRRRWRLRGKAA